MKNKMLILLFPIFMSFQVLAENECLNCAERKLKMCAEECALVPANLNKDCQKSCISQYCSHKCGKDSEKTALDTIFNIPCEQCKEKQYDLCETSCKKPSPYQNALCQIDCTQKRCDKECRK